MSLETRIKLGNVTPARRRLAAATGQVSVPVIPTSHYWATSSENFPMYGNVAYGDCSCASVGHMIEIWCANNGSVYLPTLADIVHVYKSTPDAGGGGRDQVVVLDFVKNHGIGSKQLHKIYWREVAPTRDSVRQTTYFLGGGCVVTLNLPNSVKTGRTWRVSSTNSTPGGFGSHSVDVVGYGPNGVVVCSWGQLIPMTWGFYDKYVEQVFAVLGWDWMGADGNSPLGHSWKELALQFGIE